MDKRIRRNELCVIGLPSCDFVFSSTRSCFIAYGFQSSTLEMNLLRHILSDRSVEAVEAAGMLAPAQNAFCAKICSKIIRSQFCIVLVNSDRKNGSVVPNANVNMEYGLMLGFNKYVIPFQREDQNLPFNVAGLDTVKYTDENFHSKASAAIDLAIQATRQENPAPLRPDQLIETFLLTREVVMVRLQSEGDRDLFELGRPLGFNMLMSFDGLSYLYFGNFTSLRPELVIWRLKTLERLITARFGSIEERVKLGIAKVDASVAAILEKLFKHMRFWVLVTSEHEKRKIMEAMKDRTRWPVEVFSISDIETALKSVE